MGESLDTDQVERLRIERARAGDLEAFEGLYRAHVRQVYGVCRRLLETAQDAEDMTQAVFLRAWHSLEGFRGQSNFGTWLRRIAVHRVLDERKSAWRRYLDPAEPELDEHPARDTSPHEHLDLERAIRQLPTGARQVLVLHDVEGLTHEEIAEQLGVTSGTTKTQLFRARKKLKGLLQ